ncbi:N-acetylmuramoyl-L-alanine amidase [Roseateles koreensis]|uniref:N-acetylmuramoyl-L-alanine amidase n=1 Tax=Roseateles koreensis TaxID=2987526 RepID=A0ABT5KQT8_9BURK|nr:N-acetylmuramoyl-L-alanine amidase [Roseateles koreensis]MDC8785283.1 N-acetylmuramoyl-L-alanine amidase [Roseateles koreensis]
MSRKTCTAAGVAQRRLALKTMGSLVLVLRTSQAVATPTSKNSKVAGDGSLAPRAKPLATPVAVAQPAVKAASSAGPAASAPTSGNINIVAVRVWPADEYTRVTLESDKPLVAQHFLVEGPDRLVIDIEGLELSAGLRELLGKVKPDDPFIAGVRVGQNRPRVVRIVLDLKQAAAPQIFTLAPVAAYQHRLVFDLYPKVEADPLLALIREKEKAESEAAKSVQDALGELIARIDKPRSVVAAPAPPPQVSVSVSKPNAALPGGGNAAVTAAASAAGPSAASKNPLPSSQQTPVPVPPLPVPAVPTAAEISLAQAKLDRLIVIALDPGHGGEDPGAIGPSGLREKDVVLEVALQLRDRLNANPNIRVMLTRDADFFVPLQERVRKARRVQADLFVSIHADAFVTPAARGASVFALSDGAASSQTARWIANKENAADLVGGANINTGAVKDANVLKALLDMSTAAQIKDSLKLGSEVLGQMGRVGNLHKRAVEQAGFAVLKAPDVPSILVETAFISNPEEETKLRDPDYQNKLVAALATGIARYFAKNPPLSRHRPLT